MTTPRGHSAVVETTYRPREIFDSVRWDRGVAGRIERRVGDVGVMTATVGASTEKSACPPVRKNHDRTPSPTGFPCHQGDDNLGLRRGAEVRGITELENQQEDRRTARDRRLHDSGDLAREGMQPSVSGPLGSSGR